MAESMTPEERALEIVSHYESTAAAVTRIVKHICAAEAAAREEGREACATAMRAGLVEIRRRLIEMPGVTCGMNDVIDHALGSDE